MGDTDGGGVLLSLLPKLQRLTHRDRKQNRRQDDEPKRLRPVPKLCVQTVDVNERGSTEDDPLGS